MKNSKKVIFTSALLAGAAITVSATEVLSGESSYTDLGTGSELRNHILFSEQSDLDVNVFEMKCAAKEKEETTKAKKGKKTGTEKATEGKCGEGKCGAEDDKANTKKSNELKAKSGKVDAKKTDAKKLEAKKKAKDSKTKEAKCGEGKCGVE